jgi:hypothetical protein
LPLANAGALSSHTGVQLLASLDECADNIARARLTLDVLCRQTGARAGLMFLIIDDRTDLLAATSGETCSEQMLQAVQRYLDSHAQAPAHTQTGDSDSDVVPTWPPELADYRALLLSHEHARGLILTGVVVLARPAQDFAYPGRLLAALSRFWAGTGEVSTLLAADDSAP